MQQMLRYAEEEEEELLISCYLFASARHELLLLLLLFFLYHIVGVASVGVVWEVMMGRKEGIPGEFIITFFAAQ